MGERPILDLRDDVIKPLPSQLEFLKAIRYYEYTLFGGAAGPGKSYILRWALVDLLLYWLKKLGLQGVCVGLFCENYPSLKDRQISKIERQFPQWLGRVQDTQGEGLCFFLHEDYGRGRIALRNLDDPAKYASAEFAAIAVDELTKNPRSVFDDLRFRKRWPGIEHSPFLAASNPGSIGHQWVKKLWVDRDFSGDDAALSPEHFCFIPAKAGENPYLPQSYRDTLHSLPLPMRQAMEEGNWDLFAGQYFAEWNRALHVCEPFSIPWRWRRLVSVDYGYENPSSVGWWAVDDQGEWYRYRELYQTRLTYAMLAQEIMERTPLDEDIYTVIADPSIWGDRPHHGEVVGEVGGEVLAARFRAREWPLIRANNDRLQGWQRCRELLRPVELPDGKRKGKLHIFSTCANFLRTVPAMVHDPVRVEDLDTDAEDHCFESRTLVETDHGGVPIEALVGTEGTVYSVGGSLQPYRSCRLTRRQAPLIRVEFEDGRVVRCTPDHRFMTPHGWHKGIDLTDEYCYDVLSCESRCFPTPFNRLMASATIAAGGTFNVEDDDCIERSGRFTRERSPQGSLSTISTTTGATTRSKILRCSPQHPMRATMREPVSMESERSTWPSNRLRDGIEALKGERGTVNTLSNASDPYLPRRGRNTASSANASMASRRSGGVNPNTATPTAVLVRCVRVVPAGRADVFCLTVPTTSAFVIEGGLLVANCADEWRYAVNTKLNLSAPTHLRRKMRERPSVTSLVG